MKKQILGSLTLIGLAILLIKRKDVMNYVLEEIWDFKTQQKIKELQPDFQSKIIEFIVRAEKELGIKLRVYEAYRSNTRQAELYAKGRTAPGPKVTNAKPGQSKHNYRLAIDLVEIKNGEALWNNANWAKIGALGKSLGLIWGGDFKSIVDKPHFESAEYTIAELQSLNSSGKVSNGYITV